MINVYWAPWHDPSVYAERYLTYQDPTWLLNDLSAEGNRLNQVDNWLKCPAVVTQLSNTIVLTSTSDVHVQFAGNTIHNKLNNDRLQSHILINSKAPSLQNSGTLNLSCNWIFFADKPLDIVTMDASMHRTEHSKYGYYVPGTFDISKWFRPVEYAFQLWDGVDEFKTVEGEPLMYVKFNTTEKIKLHRFYMNDEIFHISKGCIAHKKFSKIKALNKLYDIFLKKNYNIKLLELIKRNTL